MESEPSVHTSTLYPSLIDPTEDEHPTTLHGERVQIPSSLRSDHELSLSVPLLPASSSTVGLTPSDSVGPIGSKACVDPSIRKGVSWYRSCRWKFWTIFCVPFIFFASMLMTAWVGAQIGKQIASNERINVMNAHSELWRMILHEPLEAGYELQQNLVKQFPQLLSTTPISVDVFNMTTLQTSPGWLSGFAEVATKHPQLRSFGMMTVLNNDTTGPKNQIYIEYTKPVNGAALDAAGQVMIQMNTADHQLLAFSPNKSLHPTNTNTYGFNQLFSSDVMYSDSSDAIRSYLGLSIPISNHSFDLTNTATFQAFQQFLQLNQTIGYLALQPPTNFNGGLRMIAATNLNQSSSPQFLTFAGYSTDDVNQLLATFPIYSGDAFLISPQGSIIASTSEGLVGSNLWSVDDDVLNHLRDFLCDEGLLINTLVTSLAYQSGLRVSGSIEDYPSYYFLAQMIPNLPDNSQFSLVVRLYTNDLFDTRRVRLLELIPSTLGAIGFVIVFLYLRFVYGCTCCGCRNKWCSKSRG